jgi:quercetin dioxygenase-like cupin family protein
MKRIDLQQAVGLLAEPVVAKVLLDEPQLRVRRIDLAAGGGIPPCRMHDDVVFVVVAGRVRFLSEGDESLVDAPGAVYVPGGATERSMDALAPSTVLAVQARRPAEAAEAGGSVG